MTTNWDIGEEAKKLDEKPIIERLKLGKRSLKKMGYALIFYSLIMILFYFCL
jgi:hypothetical protein